MSKADSEILRTPVVLANETLPNRLGKAAMTEGLADAVGRPTERHQRLYDAWGRGGAGLLITGNVIVDRDHLERPGNVVIDREPDTFMRAALTAWAQSARVQGAGLWMQISHAGRQTQRLVNETPAAPSAVALAMPGKTFGKPRAITEGEIEDLIKRFALAAKTARETGFSGVQIHAAHGYLISQFLSPRSNLRTDSWGGSLTNRARFLRTIVRETRLAVGRDFTVAVKLNSADFQSGGFGPADSLEVLGWLKDDGVDVAEISGGTYEQPRMAGMDGLQKPDLSGLPKSTAAREAYFLDFARMARSAATIPLMVTGGLRSASEMASAVQSDGIAIVGLGRPLCVDPLAPLKLLSGADSLDRWEQKLQIGPGLLGPKSPVAMIKAINGFGALYWYYQQLRRMGDGLAPDTRLSVMKALKQEQAAQQAALAEARSA
ncbi:MAG: NADH:flavin oxidoreductase/NADH oxidase family protein [Caulobacterales bacterium]|jgi:2,4-dienoyl-CoA reductase-like NADH-dependent reductase (Old Yellow Enzyme family)